MDIDIAYAATRAHAYRTYLIPSRYIKRELGGSKSLDEFVSYLHMTHYRDKLSGLGEVSLEELIKLFRTVFSERVATLSKGLPEKYHDFVRNYLLIFDIESVMEILSEKISGKPHRELEYYRYPFSAVDFSGFLAAPNPESLIMMLLKEPLAMEEDTVDLWRRYKTLYVVEMGLLRAYYVRLIQLSEELPGEEKEAIMDILGPEIDIMNISIAIGPMLYGYSPSLAARMLIPYKYKVPASALMETYRPEARAMMALIPEEYRPVARSFLMREDVTARTLTRRLILRHILTILPKLPISFAYIFGIIKLCEFEYRNLIAIAKGISLGLSSERIRSLLIVDEI